MDIFKVSSSALESQRVRMNTIASNMANAQTVQQSSPPNLHDVSLPQISKPTSKVSVQQSD